LSRSTELIRALARRLLSISPRVIEALHGHRDSDANLSRVVTQEQKRRRGVSPDGVDCVGVSNKPLLVELRVSEFTT